METKTAFDVIIIGGSYAGLSSAMALGRSLRSTLIIDSGLPCNRQTPHSHNFITHDGQKPAVIADKAKRQVLDYDRVIFENDKAVEGVKNLNDFTIRTESGKEFTAKKLIFTTGIKDEMLPIPGFSECWGISVIHCPYCHGYEFKNEPTGILANGEGAFHYAQLVNNLTSDLIVFTNGKAHFSAEEEETLAKHKIQVVETELEKIEHEEGHLSQIHLTDGTSIARKALYAHVPFTQHSNIPEQLGCAFDENGLIKVDDFQKTTVEGIYAAGDNSSPMRSVANAVAKGNVAGAITNMELTKANF